MSDSTENKIEPSKIRHSSQIVSLKKEHNIIIDMIVKMLSANIQSYFAEFLLFMNHLETNTIPTMGVNIQSNGMNLYYNPRFIQSLHSKDLMFIMIHECFHLLFDHTKRSIFYNKELANIAQDAIINTIIVEDIIKQTNEKMEKIGKSDVIDIPKYRDEFFLDKDGNFILDEKGDKIKNPMFSKNMGIFIDKDYTGEHIFENYYQYLKDKQEDYKKRKEQQKPSGDSDGQGGKGEGDGIPKDSFGKPSYGNNGKGNVECSSLDSIFDSLEKGEQVTLDTHIEDDITPEARKSIVNDFMQRLKNRGLVTADMESTLNKLRKSKKDYLKEIKRQISSNIIGTSKMKSITRPNRRGIEGIKGKKKFKNAINCILDTSGSMGNEFEKVLAYIYQNDIEVNLIQIDVNVKSVNVIKNKTDLQRTVIKGHGGTMLQPGIDYISDDKNKLSRFNSICLTDGYTDTLDFTKSKGNTLILTTGTEPRIITS